MTWHAIFVEFSKVFLFSKNKYKNFLIIKLHTSIKFVSKVFKISTIFLLEDIMWKALIVGAEKCNGKKIMSEKEWASECWEDGSDEKKNIH